ncbi:MAG: carbohydrate ABC transporter permease [Candidatus Izemoplasmatales bacterium]|jgi:multiple sugar transport system permease protein|nr:carbohydrate ABC transporter permease [Acholeplasmataceae bacterium]
MAEVFVKNEKSYKTKKILFTIGVYIFLGIVTISVLIPFYWMILTSLKTQIMIEQVPPIIFLKPSEWQINNYRLLFELVPSGPRRGEPLFPFFTYMGNTVLVSIITTIGTTLTTILAAYAFARLNFKGRDIVFAILLSTMMIPGEIFILTNFLTVYKLGWYDIFNQTYSDAILAMTIPFMTSVFYTFYLRQTFKQVPNELYFAAKVDGTTDFQYLWKIMVPVAMPTIVTIVILNSMGAWNAYIWPQMVTTKDAYRLVSNGLRGAFTDTSTGRTDFGQQMAAAVLVTIPVLLIFFTFRKQIMRGVSRSGIKG